ncbi:MAG: cytochrome c [Pseudomonadota bacterium]
MKILTATPILSTIAILGFAGCAANHAIAEPSLAQSPEPSTVDAGGDAEVPVTSIDVDSLVQGRRAAYWMSAGLFGGMFEVINTGGDVTKMQFPARAVANWAKVLPGMFPEGSVNDESNALPTVWSESEAFEALAAQYAERAEQLAAIAAEGDKDAFAEQWRLTRETCASCHSQFRRDRSAEASGGE